MILISLAILTIIGLSGTNKYTLLPIAYTSVIPLVMLVLLILHLKEYYVALIIYSITGLYICYMQITLGQIPYLHIITNMLYLTASIYELKQSKIIKQNIND